MPSSLSVTRLGVLSTVSPLSQALMNVNARLRELYPDSEELFDIVLMTNNHAQVGVRLINSINHYGMMRLTTFTEKNNSSTQRRKLISSIFRIMYIPNMLFLIQV